MFIIRNLQNNLGIYLGLYSTAVLVVRILLLGISAEGRYSPHSTGPSESASSRLIQVGAPPLVGFSAGM